MTDPVVVDVEATIKAEVAKAIAAAKAEETKVVTAVKAFIAKHAPTAAGAVGGWVVAKFGIIEAALKLI